MVRARRLQGRYSKQLQPPALSGNGLSVVMRAPRSSARSTEDPPVPETRIRPVHRHLLLFALAASMVPSMRTLAADPPGGFIEKAYSTNVRAKLTPTQIQAMLPARGLFTFPAPYLTQGIRLTNSSDCG